jgi:hypothetical protein
MSPSDIVMQVHKHSHARSSSWRSISCTISSRSPPRAASRARLSSGIPRNLRLAAGSRRSSYGAPLFDRTTHTVNLTPAGESFRQTAEDILRRLAASRLDAQELARGAPTC